MNKIARLLVSTLWLMLSVILPIIIVLNLKFPVIDNERYGYIFIPVSIAFPLFFLVYSIVSFKTKKNNKIVDSFIIVGLIAAVVYTFICTLGFTKVCTAVYPLVSSTQDIDDYLIIEDDLVESDYKYICTLFPKTIPDGATNIDYYYCDWFFGYRLDASWNLPYEEYLLDKENTLAMYKGVSTIEDEKTIIEYSFDTDVYIAKKEFIDSECLIKYEFIRIP